MAFSMWTVLDACKTTLEGDATVGGWVDPAGVIISDVGDYLEPSPGYQPPYIVIKDAACEVTQRSGCANTINATVRVWVVVLANDYDTSRGVKDSLNYREDIVAALDDSTWGVGNMSGRWHWVIQPESDKPFIDPEAGEFLPFHRAEVVFEGTIKEPRS